MECLAIGFFKEKQRPNLKKDGFRAIALSVFSYCYTTVLVDSPHEERQPIEWRDLHVGAERGFNCEHRQALPTNTLEAHWEWQEDGRTDFEPQFSDTRRLSWQAWIWNRRSTWPSPLWYQGFFLWQECMGMWRQTCRRDEEQDVS